MARHLDPYASGEGTAPFSELARMTRVQNLLHVLTNTGRLEGILPLVEAAVGRCKLGGRETTAIYYVFADYPQNLDMTFRLPVSQRLKLLAAGLNGLQTLHAMGIAHSDLSPESFNVDSTFANCVLAGLGTAFPILDSGFAAARAQQPPSRDHLDYCSPEELAPANRSVGIESDLYSIGLILYRTIAGCLPPKPQDGSGPALELPDLPPYVTSHLRALCRQNPGERTETVASTIAMLNRTIAKCESFENAGSKTWLGVKNWLFELPGRAWAVIANWLG